MARSTEFRGYGPATLAGTGLFAMPPPSRKPSCCPTPPTTSAYLRIWIATAILSATLIGIQTLTRTRRIHSGMADEMIRMAVEQFLPSAGAGALITFVLVRFVPAVCVDASRHLANHLQPRRVFVLPISAPPHDRCRVWYCSPASSASPLPITARSPHGPWAFPTESASCSSPAILLCGSKERQR